MSELNIMYFFGCRMVTLFSREHARDRKTQETRSPSLVSEAVVQSSTSSTEEKKTLVMSSDLAMLIFLLYFILLRACNFEGYGNKF